MPQHKARPQHRKQPQPRQAIQTAFKAASRAARYPVIYMIGALEAARLLRARLFKPQTSTPPRLP